VAARDELIYEDRRAIVREVASGDGQVARGPSIEARQLLQLVDGQGAWPPRGPVEKLGETLPSAAPALHERFDHGRWGVGCMREDYRLLTPENVELRFDVAGLGSRLGAAIIDYVVIGFSYVVLIVGGMVLGGAADAAIRAWDPGGAAAIAGLFLAVSLIFAFGGWWGYFLLFELVWNGQSPGKRLLGLRVVRRDGRPLDFVTALVRNVLRWIDQAALIGVFAMVVDGSSRRLGDIAAGTIVVREPRRLRQRALAAVELPRPIAANASAHGNTGKLTMAHYTLIRDFFSRADRLRPEAADALASRLAGEVARVLDLDPSRIGPPEAFLAGVVRDFDERRRYADTE